jgi:hypothetical protein
MGRGYVARETGGDRPGVKDGPEGELGPLPVERRF